ncbi:hypothetical protein ABPG75_011096 [Micractinium tetrahymenae]
MTITLVALFGPLRVTVQSDCTCPALEHLQLFKAVGCRRGPGVSPWGLPQPGARVLLPGYAVPAGGAAAAPGRLMLRYAEPPPPLGSASPLYCMMAQGRPPGASIPLLAQVLGLADARLPPNTWLWCGWCTADVRDPRFAALDNFAVPEALHGRGLGRALLTLLQHELPQAVQLPTRPVPHSLGFWLRTSPPALRAFILRHGEPAARELCLDPLRLAWPLHFYEEMLQRAHHL